MDKELHKCLINFYSKLETTDAKWKETKKSTERILEILKHRLKELQFATSPEVDNAEIFRTEGLRERLVAKIHERIEEEIALVQEAVAKLNNYSQDLRQRLSKIEVARSKFSLDDESIKELVEGTTHRPKLNLLLEWAIDATDYYRNLYVSMSQSLKGLDYKDKDCVEKLSASLLEPDLARAKIDSILAFTQFLARET